MQRDLMHTVVYHLYDDWQPTLGNDQVGPAVKRQIINALTAWSVLSCDVADPSLTCLKRHAEYIRQLGWERLVAALKLLKAEFQSMEVPTVDFIGLHAPYAEIIRPIRATLIKAMKGDARAFTNVNTWLAFVTKLHVPNPTLADDALKKWISAEEGIGSAPQKLVDMLNYTFRCLPEFDMDGFYPHHSSGAVAESYLDRMGNAEVWSKDQYLERTQPDQILHWGGLGSYYDLSGSFPHRTNVLTFVPKSATALRAISMEPCLLQFLQQGIKDQLYRNFEMSPYLRDSIHLRDSGFNRRLALEGSRNGQWATIDLSSASDTVSSDLVSRGCVGTTWFRPLMSTRSLRTLLPNGDTFDLRKFAPMGSACAFPVECLVFLSAARLAAQEDTSTRYERQHVLVYGDDIIVHSAVADRLVSVLTEAGFTVNQDKSFIRGPFRESCGIEAYLGVDITPMYHRVSYLDGTRRLYPGLVSHANEAFIKGFFRLREYYISQIRNVTGRRYRHVPYTVYGDDDSRLWSRCGESSPDGYDRNYQSPYRRELQTTVKEHRINPGDRTPNGELAAYQSCLQALERAQAPWDRGPLLEGPHSHVVSTTSAIAVRRVLSEH